MRRLGIAMIPLLMVGCLGQVQDEQPGAADDLSRRQCGDGLCQRFESCTICSRDCGQCSVQDPVGAQGDMAQASAPVNMAQSGSPSVATTSQSDTNPPSVSVGTGNNWYVRPTSQGANNGKDWNNAWSVSSLNASWSSVSPGDTVWLAGGTYTTKLTASKSGTNAARIYIKRVLATDSVPASATGWEPSFDSHVSFVVPYNGPNESQLLLSGDYITADGQIPSGIKFKLPANPAGQKINAAMMDGSYCVVQYTEAAGPGSNANHYGTPRLLAIYGNYDTSRFNYGHGLTQPYTLAFNHGTIVEHDTIADNGSLDHATYHDDIMEFNQATGSTIRYCTWDGWSAEGVMMWNGAGSMWVYGNTFKNGGAGGVLWPSKTLQTEAGPVYFYNNTLINASASQDQSANGTWAAGSIARNNIYWANTNWVGGWGAWPIADRDYEFAATPLQAGNPPGGHNILNGTNPFVNFSSGDYRIVSTVGATYPRDKGVALSPPYNVDPDGITRGADGLWDIGAYEY